MKRQIFKSKIHRATVTEANVDYEGSITIDSLLLQAADIFPYEAVHVWNITNGSRLITYAIKGNYGSGVICINGAGARLCKPGDLVIIATFVEMSDRKARGWNPLVINVDNKNNITKSKEIIKEDINKKPIQVITSGSYLHKSIG